MAESEGERLGKGSAADLLSAWRAAERDHVAASQAATVAQLASAAADRASEAAKETAEAARLSLEAAQRAERAARETADAANVLSSAASREREIADHAVDEAVEREDVAKQAFHEAQGRNFRKDG